MPFEYPAKKHIRTETPQVYAQYKEYKPHLKKEFGGRCVYCRKTDLHQDKGSFHVEHYKPKRQFPELINEYSNLFYACASCNRYKGNYWSDDKLKQALNPCYHVMSHNLVFLKELVAGRTSQGEFNIELLRLNNDESILYRKDTIETVLSLVKIVLTLKDINTEKARNDIERVVIMLVKLTYHDKDKIRRVLKV